MPFAFLFPGQGSQSIGMFDGFADPDRIVAHTLEEVSEAVGRDLAGLFREGPEEELGRTETTQPAMLAAGVAVSRLWAHREGPPPALAAGHSLGEYSALVAADSLELGQAASLVADRARYMQEAVPEGGGKMAAILGLDDETVTELCQRVREQGVVEPANFNAPGQVVVAGAASAVGALMEAAQEAGAKRSVELPVSIPSHCALMGPAAKRLEERLGDIEIRPPRVPVVTNVDAEPVTDPAAIRDALVRQLANPVRWTRVIERMAGEGIDRVLEMGPGKVLCGLNRRIDRAMACRAVQDDAALEEAVTEAA